ncbi:MAG TPA: acetyltransferase [Phenylobacterium sp.]
MTAVTLEPAQPHHAVAIANMMQLYTHDFSEQWAGQDRGELGEDGLFDAYPYLDSYWSEPDRVPLLIRNAGALAGFCLLNRHAHGAQPVDRNMAEFFVVRKHRSAGVGAAAASLAFAAYPGVWEVAVARRNLRALPFWRRTIETLPNLRDLHELTDATDWDGTIFRFQVG